MENDISIREIQHYIYCPHRWGLISIDRAWAENYFIARANLAHKRVHSAEEYASRGRNVYTAVRIWDDDYGIYGVADCIEVKDDKITIVEYKPTMPKDSLYREEDAMQVFAQKLCVDNIFQCDSSAVIYYANTRRRVSLSLDREREHFDKKLKMLLLEMRACRKRGRIPPARKSAKCSGCSMLDICIPKTVKAKYNISKEIALLMEESQ